MKNHGKALLSLALVGSMLFPYSTAFAAEVTTPGGSANSEVTLTVGDTAPKIFSVTVPSEIPVNIRQDGTVEVAKNLNIRNDSSDAVKVTAISVAGKNGWSVAEYAADFSAKPDNSKVIAMQFRGDGTDSAGDITLTPDNWNIPVSTNLDIQAQVKLAKQTQEASKSNIATVSWSFNWKDATDVPDVPDTSAISHNWKDGTPMLTGSAKDVTFDWTSTADTNSIASVESSEPGVASIDSKATSTLVAGQTAYTVTGKSVGTTTITATLTSGESTSFDVTVNEVKPGTGGDGDDIEIAVPGDTLKPGDKLNPNMEIEIPVTGPDGDSTITVKPEIPDTELKPGDNEIQVEVDINGVKFTIIIKVTVAGGNPSDGLDMTIQDAQAMGFTFSAFGDGLQIDAFENKQFKKEINVPEQIGDFKVRKIGNRVFENQSNLTKITLPDSVNYVSDWAFLGCTKTTVYALAPDLHATKYAFSGIKELYVSSLTTGTDISGVVHQISSGKPVYVNGELFTDTEMVKSMSYGGSDTVTVLCIGDDGSYIDPKTLHFHSQFGLNKPLASKFETDVVIPKYVNGLLVQELDPVVYYGDSDSAELESLYIPDSVTSFDGKTLSFYGFKNAGKIKVYINNNREAFKDFRFSKCQVFFKGEFFPVTAGTLKIPEGTTQISDSAFAKRSDIVKAILPDSLAQIGAHAFWSCPNLTESNIPRGLSIIPTAMYADCTQLAGITIPSSVTTIETKAFARCTSLESVTIPESVTSIGENAFENVPHIEYHGTASGAPWGAKSMN